MRFISLLLVSFSVHGAVIWPNGTRLQTFQNGFLFGNGQTIDSAASGFTFGNAAQFNGPFVLQQSATPSTPSAGFNKLYFKNDNNLYKLNSAGTELAVGELNIAGQNQSNIAVTEIKVPNNQLTQTSAGQGLVETGNLNLLSNPGFEHSTFSTGWVTTGTTATLTAETVTIISGLKAIETVASSQNISIVQDSTLYASQIAGMQGYVQMSCSNTAPSVSLCARGAGVTSTTDCVTLDTTGTWKQYEIPVVLSATSNGISIAATSVTGTTICDDAYVGLISGKTPEVSQAQLAGESYFAGTTNCLWNRASTTIGAFTTDADCPGPTIVRQNLGSWQTTDANLPRQTVNDLPAGEYKATFIFPNNMNVSGSPSFAINDGTTTCEGTLGNSATAAIANTNISCTFSYTSPGNRVFEIYAASSSNNVDIGNGVTTPRGSVKFILEYYPPASKIYSQNNNNAWINFTPTGSWVSNTTYTGKYRIANGMAEIQYQWNTSGAPTAATLTLNLPNSWVIDTSKFTTGTNYNFLPTRNCILRDAAPAAYNCIGGYTNTTSFYVAPGDTSGARLTSNGVVDATSPMTWATGDYGAITVILPIVGISESMITGTFAEMMKVPNITKPKTCLLQVTGASDNTACTASPCTERYDSCGTTNACTRAGAGLYSCVHADGTWAASSPVLCFCRSVSAPRVEAGDGTVRLSTASGGFTWETKYEDFTSTAADAQFNCQCTGAAP